MGWVETRCTHVKVKKYVQKFDWKFLKTYMRKLRGWIITRCTVKKTSWESVGWIRVSQEVDQWRAVLKTAASFRVLWLSKNVLANGVTHYFSRTLAHAVVLFGTYLFSIICRKVNSAGRIPVQSQRTYLTVFYLCDFHR